MPAQHGYISKREKENNEYGNNDVITSYIVKSTTVQILRKMRQPLQLVHKESLMRMADSDCLFVNNQK